MLVVALATAALATRAGQVTIPVANLRGIRNSLTTDKWERRHGIVPPLFLTANATAHQGAQFLWIAVPATSREPRVEALRYE
jgi:hypothetical protein